MKQPDWPYPTMEQNYFPFPTVRPDEGAPLTNKQAQDIRQALNAARVKDAELQGIRILHVFNKHRPHGGFTVAYRPCSNYKNSKMVECAVSTCSVEDTFNKRIGTQLALDNFANGRTVDLPILAAYCANDITFAIKACFIAVYNAVGPGYITPH